MFDGLRERYTAQGWRGILLSRIAPWAVATLSALLLVAHSLKWEWVDVDGSTLGLLGVLLLSSRWDQITKLRFGDFEAEIAPEEVARVRSEVATQVGPSDPFEEKAQHRDLTSMLDSDPTLGLAAIRIEIERKLRALYRISGGTDSRRGAGLLAHELARMEVLPPPLAAALSEVLRIANRAIHGETIRDADAQALGLLGVQLVDELQDLYESRVAEPLESLALTPQERDDLLGRTFRVVTVVPLLDQPVKNVRILDQDALSLLLDAYNEYAESIVSIESIEADGPRE